MITPHPRQLMLLRVLKEILKAIYILNLMILIYLIKLIQIKFKIIIIIKLITI